MGWYVQPAWDDRQIRLGLVFFRRYARPIRSPETVDHEGGGYWAFEFTDAPGDFQVLFLPGTEARLKPAFDRLIAGDARAAYAIAQRLAGPCAATLEVQAQLGYLALEAGDAAAALRWLAPGVRAGYVGDGSLAHVAAAELQLGHTEAAAGAAARAARVYGPHAP